MSGAVSLPSGECLLPCLSRSPPLPAFTLSLLTSELAILSAADDCALVLSALCVGGPSLLCSYVCQSSAVCARGFLVYPAFVSYLQTTKCSHDHESMASIGEESFPWKSRVARFTFNSFFSLCMRDARSAFKSVLLSPDCDVLQRWQRGLVSPRISWD